MSSAFQLQLLGARDIVQSTSLPFNLLISEGMPDLFNDEPRGYDSDSPKAEVKVRVSNGSHD